jgi:hypothetical protein
MPTELRNCAEFKDPRTGKWDLSAERPNRGRRYAELKALIRPEAKGRRIVLDLKDLTLVGQDAIAFLDRWRIAQHTSASGS